MTLSLETIVKEMGCDWVNKMRCEARRYFHPLGTEGIREYVIGYVKIAYNSAKAA